VKKTSMSVREMQMLLGICKTESYWLVKKGFLRSGSLAGECGSWLSHLMNGIPASSITSELMGSSPEQNGGTPYQFLTLATS